MEAIVDALLASLWDSALYLIEVPLLWGERFFLGYIATFLLLAFVSYRFVEGRRFAIREFFSFVFPKRIYANRSALIDYAIYLINFFTSPFIVLVTVGIQTAVSIAIAEWLVDLNDGPVVEGSWDATTYLVFILGFTLAADFSVYWVHRLHHAWSVLWPLHALHHSAEVMTPVTLFRKHPLWNLEADAATKTLTGIFQGVFVFVFYGAPSAEVLFGLNTIYVLFNLAGSNLRHSHIWLSWGKPLSYVFISPAMHQIHHDPKRMRKNYGEIFAIWDWAFGTLYVPNEREHFEIGLGEPNPHDSVLKAYLVPIRDSLRALLPGRGPGSGQRGASP